MANDSDTDSSRKALLRNSDKQIAPSTTSGFQIGVHAAWFRLATYFFLALSLACGYTLTYAYNIPEEQGGGRAEDSTDTLLDLRNNALFKYFGFNNVCIYIDELPGKYITAWTFELVIISFSIYEALEHVTMRLAYEKKVYTKQQFYIMRALAILDIALITYTIEIFAVHPKDNMFMHTIPFSALICAIIGMGLRNTYHEFHVVDFEKTSPFFKWLQFACALLMVVFSVGKLYVQYAGIVAGDPVSPSPSNIIDKGWLLFGVAIPCLKALVSICSHKVLPRKDRLLLVHVGTTSVIDCGCCGKMQLPAHDSSKDDSSSRKSLASNSDPPYYQFGVHQSWFRAATYSFLALAVVCGYILTYKYNIPEEQGGGRTEDSTWALLDLKNNALFKYFGYNNVCIYVDELPGKYITMWLFELLLISFSLYTFFGDVSVRIAYENKVYTKTQFYIMRALAILDIILITYTIEVFGVHPKDNMFMHTLPFSSLVVAIMGMGLRNMYHDFHMVDFKATYSFLKWLELACGLLMAVFSVGKLYIQYSGIVLRDPVSAPLGKFNDKGWLLFAVAFPCAKSLVTIFAPKLLPRTDQFLHVTVGTTSMIDCGCCQIKIPKNAANEA